MVQVIHVIHVVQVYVVRLARVIQNIYGFHGLKMSAVEFSGTPICQKVAGIAIYSSRGVWNHNMPKNGLKDNL